MPQPLTCAGKEAFSRVLAAELAPRSIRGICILPHAIADAPAAGSYTKDLFKTLIWYRPGTKAAAGLWLHEWLPGPDMAQRTMSKRLPTLSVAATAAFLASDRAVQEDVET